MIYIFFINLIKKRRKQNKKKKEIKQFLNFNNKFIVYQIRINNYKFILWVITMSFKRWTMSMIESSKSIMESTSMHFSHFSK